MTCKNSDEIRALLSQFLKEREWLQNVTPKTLALYRYSFQAFEGAMDNLDTVKERIASLRQRGLSAVSVNTYIRHVKAFYRWQNKAFKLPVLKEEQTILHTLSANDILAILRYKAVGTNLLRAHIVALVLLDCGLRISECLSLTKEDVDFANLVLRVKGKGGKHRLVPFSLELRKHLFRYMERLAVNHKSNIIFATKNGTQITVRNFQRDFKKLCSECGIIGVRCSPHTLRHTFAANWVRKGGDIFLLSKCLGHSDIQTTTRYLQSLGIEALQEVQARVSLLSR